MYILESGSTPLKQLMHPTEVLITATSHIQILLSFSHVILVPLMLSCSAKILLWVPCHVLSYGPQTHSAVLPGFPDISPIIISMQTLGVLFLCLTQNQAADY